MPMLALLAILSAAPGSAAAAATPRPAAPASLAPFSPDALYSKRALRRARLLIQMRMLELRNERLECIRAALLRRLPEVLRPPEAAARSAPVAASNACLLKL